MQYCSIEEAWGIPKNNKKKKKKRLYNSKIPKYIEDTSFLEGGHDNHCKIKEDKNMSSRNKDRFSHSRGNKNIYKKTTRTPNIQVSYDQAAEEYRKFQLENKEIKNQEKEPYLIEGFESSDELNSIEDIEKTFNDVDYNTDAENSNIYSPSTDYLNEEENNIQNDIQNNDSDSDNDNDMDEEIKNIIEETQNNDNSNKIKKNKDNTEIEDIDYRLNNLNRNVNSLIQKLNENDFFDDDSNDNIHDLILFILFGVFIIFVLDTIYKLGRVN